MFVIFVCFLAIAVGVCMAGLGLYFFMERKGGWGDG